MTFDPKQWKNFPSTDTPRSADALIDQEVRLSTYTDEQVTAVANDLATTTGELASTSARKPAAQRMQYVDADSGSDVNDGLSWGTAKQTLAAAAAGMPNGGRIQLNSAAGQYPLTASLDCGGLTIEGVSRAPGRSASLAVISHKFDGDMMTYGALGGALRNVLLYEDDAMARTGAAIAAASTAGQIGGTILLENVIISGPPHGWERDMVLDGLAQPAFGVRKVECRGVQFFGCRTAGETIVIRRGVHMKFTDGFVDQAPTAVTQGVRIEDPGSTDVMFSNFEVLGDFYTEAAGQLVFVGRVTGTITCAAGSENNVFVGVLGAAPVNNGGAGNTFLSPRGLQIGDVQLARNAANEWITTDRFVIDKAGAGNALTIRNGAHNLLNVLGTTGQMSWADGAGGDLDTSIARGSAGVVDLTSVLRFPTAVAAADVPNNSIFRDAADGVIKRKDATGAVAAI